MKSPKLRGASRGENEEFIVLLNEGSR